MLLVRACAVSSNWNAGRASFHLGADLSLPFGQRVVSPIFVQYKSISCFTLTSRFPLPPLPVSSLSSSPLHVSRWFVWFQRCRSNLHWRRQRPVSKTLSHRHSSESRTRQECATPSCNGGRGTPIRHLLEVGNQLHLPVVLTCSLRIDDAVALLPPFNTKIRSNSDSKAVRKSRADEHPHYTALISPNARTLLGCPP